MWGSVMCEVDSLRDNDNRKRSIKDGIIRLFQNPLFLAFFLNALALLIRIIFFDIKYEVSDDYMTDAVLSGAYGSGYDPHLLFGNVILGHFLVFLYKLIPQISFYFVLLVVLGFVSVTSVLYLLFKKNRNGIAYCLALVFLFFFADDLYILVQFTKVSTVAGIAGGLLVLHGLWEEKKHRSRFIVLGSILTIIGTMVRFTTIYIFAFFLVIAFLRQALTFLSSSQKKLSLKTVKKEEWKTIGKNFLVCLLLIGILFGLQFAGIWLSNRDEGYRSFNRFHDIRAGITDVIDPDYESVQAEYEARGLDRVDYYMLTTWNFIDSDVYSDELLEEIGTIHKQASNKETHSLSYVADLLIQRNTLTYWSALGIYLLVFFAIVLGKQKGFPVMILIASIFMQALFVYTGRTMYRVEWSVYFCAASCLLCGFEMDTESKLGSFKKKFFGKERHVVSVYSIILVAGLMLTRVPRLLPDTTYKNMSDDEYAESFNTIMLDSGSFHPEKYVFPTSDRKPYLALTERMETDTEHFYYVDFYTGIQSLYFAYDPWIRPDEGLFSNSYAYFGSVAMHHPGEREALKKNGADPDSPYRSVINDEIYLVDSDYSVLKLAYIRKYYYPDAKIELVDEIDGLKIWKIYIPERTEET